MNTANDSYCNFWVATLVMDTDTNIGGVAREEGFRENECLL